MNVAIPDLSPLLPKLVAGLPTALLITFAAVLLNYTARRTLLMIAHRTSLTEREVLPVHRVIKWLIAAVALMLALGAFGINLGGFWGILSTILAMVAIGFVAVWSVLSNTLCTVIIMLFRPFSVGDEIEFVGENVKGQVSDLNFVYTTLDAGDGSVMQVPNNLFFQKVIRRRHASVPVSPAVHMRDKRTDVPSSSAVRANIRVRWDEPAMRRTNSMPFGFGMATSTNATSGANCAILARASSASSASATTEMVGALSTRDRTAARTFAWSSAMRIR